MSKKILLSLVIIGIAAAMAIGATTAYFTADEEIEENVFQAGTLEIKQGINDLGTMKLTGLMPGQETDPQKLTMGNDGSLDALIDKIEVSSIQNNDVNGNKVSATDYADNVNVTVANETGKPLWKGTLGDLNKGNAIDGTDRVFLAKKGSGVNYTTRDYWFTFELDSDVNNDYQNEGVEANFKVNATQVKDKEFDAGERLVAIQNNDSGWCWQQKEDCDSFDNLYGVTAMGLLRAYEFSGKSNYFDAAEDTAYAVSNGYNSVERTSKWEEGGKLTNADILFLQRIGKYYGDDDVYDNAFNNKAKDAVISRWNAYNNDAQEVYNSAKEYREDAPDVFYWDLAPLMEATLDVANTIDNDTKAMTLRNNALELAEIVANDQKSSGWFTSGSSASYQLGQASAIRILQLADNASLDVDYSSQINNASNALWEHKNNDNSFQFGEMKSIQTSAYTALAFEMIGHHGKATKVIDYIESQQLSNGGWYEEEETTTEMPEVNSEALRAIISVLE